MIDDAELIRRWRETEEGEAASLLFQKHYKGVYNYAYKFLRNHHDAEEVAMDTFAKAFRKLETLEAPDKLSGWLRTIVHRCALNWQRTKARQLANVELVSLDEPLVEEDESVSYGDIAAIDAYRHSQESEGRRHWTGVLKRLMRLLPEKDRQVMESFHLEELTYREIAALSAVSEKSVDSRLMRTRKLVKAIVRQLSDLLNRLSDAEALMMRRYLFDGTSPEEIAESLGISPDAVAASLERVMQRWKKIIDKQNGTDPGTTQSSQAGGVNINLWLSFVKRVTRFMLSWGVSDTRHAHKHCENPIVIYFVDLMQEMCYHA